MTADSIARDTRSVQVADVFKAGRRAAQLRRTGSGTEFAYLPEFASDGVAIATTLPISAYPLRCLRSSQECSRKEGASPRFDAS